MKRQSEQLTDDEWDSVQALLPPQKPKTGRPAKDHRTVVDGILWQQSTGLPWRQLPKRFGPWQTVYSRLRRWQEAGVWAKVQATLASVDHAPSKPFARSTTTVRSVKPSPSSISNNSGPTRWSAW